MEPKYNDELPAGAINYFCPLRRCIWNMLR